MQRRYNSVEKFTEMHLATETIVESEEGELRSRSSDTRIIRGRSHENLLPAQFQEYQQQKQSQSQEQQYLSYPSSPATTIVPTTTTTIGYDRNNNGNNNASSRPSSRTTFSPQPQQPQTYLLPATGSQPLTQQPQQQQMKNPQSGTEVPHYYDSGAYGPNASDPRYSAPVQGQAWRPQSSVDQSYQPLQYTPRDSAEIQPRQQYYQRPISQTSAPQPQPILAQQLPLTQQPQQQFQGPPYGSSIRPMQNGPVSTTSTPTIRYQPQQQQQLGGQAVPIGPGHPAYIQRTPSRSAHSKSHENLGEVGSSSGETLKFAEHLDAFFENNVPGVIWIVFAVLQILFGLVSLFVAVFNFNLCYAERKIPVYLLISGLILIINGSVRLCLRIPTSASSPTTRIVVHNGRRYKQPVDKPPKSTFAPGGALRYALEGTILFAILVIVILGCVWVYGARYVQFERYRFERNYCDHTLYWVSWWSVTGHLVIFSIFIVAVITILLFGAIMSK